MQYFFDISIIHYLYIYYFLLINQCIYILEHAENRFKGHEFDNLRRMLRKILGFKEFRRSESYKSQKDDLRDAIESFRKEANKKNVDISTYIDDIENWKTQINSFSI